MLLQQQHQGCTEVGLQAFSGNVGVTTSHMSGLATSTVVK